MLVVPRPAAVSRLPHAGQRPLLLLSPALTFGFQLRIFTLRGLCGRRAFKITLL